MSAEPGDDQPAPDGKALFLSYDRWLGDGMTLVIRDTAKVVRRGHEFSETVAWLDIAMEGRQRSWSGYLNCGS